MAKTVRVFVYSFLTMSVIAGLVTAFAAHAGRNDSNRTLSFDALADVNRAVERTPQSKKDNKPKKKKAVTRKPSKAGQ